MYTMNMSEKSLRKKFVLPLLQSNLIEAIGVGSLRL